jgi:hypothetical protein
MRGQHLGGQTLGFDHKATTDSNADLDASAKRGDVSSAWAIAFVVVVLLGLASPFL